MHIYVGLFFIRNVCHSEMNYQILILSEKTKITFKLSFKSVFYDKQAELWYQHPRSFCFYYIFIDIYISLLLLFYYVTFLRELPFLNIFHFVVLSSIHNDNKRNSDWDGKANSVPPTNLGLRSVDVNSGAVRIHMKMANGPETAPKTGRGIQRRAFWVNKTKQTHESNGS